MCMITVVWDYLHFRESCQLYIITLPPQFLQSAPSQRWTPSRGGRKTFRLTLSLFVLMCRESPSINNKNCCLRACPRGLISSADPWPCHWDGSLRLEPIAQGQRLFVLHQVCPGSISTYNHTRRQSCICDTRLCFLWTCIPNHTDMRSDTLVDLKGKSVHHLRHAQGLSRQILEANTIQHWILYFYSNHFKHK